MTRFVGRFALLGAIFRALCILVPISAGVQAMAADADSTIVENAPATVTLDVFSGRPNPTWSLSDAATAELLDRLRGLAPAAGAPAAFDGLGYRAIHAELRQGGQAIAVIAARGGVICERGGKTTHYADSGRQFELWLVNTGAGHAPPEVLSYVAGEIAKQP